MNRKEMKSLSYGEAQNAFMQGANIYVVFYFIYFASSKKDSTKPLLFNGNISFYQNMTLLKMRAVFPNVLDTIEYLTDSEKDFTFQSVETVEKEVESTQLTFNFM